MLLIAKFTYNNALHSATGYPPFYATYGYNPALSFTTPTTLTILAAEERVRQLQEIHEEVKTLIKIATEQVKRNYD